MLAGRVYSQGLRSDTAAAEFRDFTEAFFQQLSSEVERGVKAADRELLRYQQAITSGSTGGDSVKTRISILTKRLATFSPGSPILLGSYLKLLTWRPGMWMNWQKARANLFMTSIGSIRQSTEKTYSK